MKSMFEQMGQHLSHRPVKVVGISMLILLAMLPGAALVKLDTGNDTLIKPSTQVYQDNQKLESSFGGQSIVVMYTTPDMNKFLSVANMNRFQDFSNMMGHTDGVYSVLTPATGVVQMTKRESTELEDKIGNMSKGLRQMADKLRSISASLSNAGPSTAGTGASSSPLSGANSTKILGQLANSQVQMGTALHKMQMGLSQMETGYSAVSTQLVQIGNGLSLAVQKMQAQSNPGTSNIASVKSTLLQVQNQLLALMQEDPSLASNANLTNTLALVQGLNHQLANNSSTTEFQPLAAQLNQSATGILKLGQQMQVLNAGLQHATQSLSSLEQGSIKSSAAFQRFQSSLNAQQGQLQMARQKQADLFGRLNELQLGLGKMATQLDGLASGLGTIQGYSSNMTASIPQNQANLDNLLYDQNGNLRDLFQPTIVDHHHVLAMVRLNGNLGDSGKQAVIQAIEHFTRSEPMSSATVMVTGKPVLDTALHTEMKDSMKKMIALALVLMLLVLSVVFRVRWRIMALPMIFLGVAATLGLMGYLSIPMTMVSMAVFPILIGLGVDYAIQFQNRYEEELQRG